MFLSIRHKPMFREALKTEVINKDTGEKIPRVIWANEATGRYRQHLIDENGNLIIDNLHSGEIESFRLLKNGEIISNFKPAKIRSKIFTGNIEFKRKELYA